MVVEVVAVVVVEVVEKAFTILTVNEMDIFKIGASPCIASKPRVPMSYSFRH